jgi:hypothetical protein
MRSDPAFTRRRLLATGALVGAGLVLGPRVARGAGAVPAEHVEFGALDPGEGWGAGWRCPGTANLRVAGGVGVLEAGSDVFPNDPRPVAFLVDCRFAEGAVRAEIATAGAQAGVVLRRTSPTDHYAALYDTQLAELSVVRRSGSDLVTLARTAAPAGTTDLVLELTAAGTAPTRLTATLTGPAGVPFSVTAADGHDALQRPGDPGVLSQARTLFPSAGPAVLPALGNVHLLPYGVQEGEAFLESPAGQTVVGEIRRQSTVAFRRVAVTTAEALAATPASVVAATTGLPRAGGARLHVASDLPADVVVEVAGDAGFTRPRRVAAGPTGAFDAFTAEVRGLPAGERVFWRATLTRGETRTAGPVRGLRVLPAAGGPGRVRIAIGSCGSQFGPLFEDLARLDPDVFVWQGDLNYPDTHGPLAQTTSAYAGIWRDFLANPRLLPVLARSAFVAVRDDHDYAVQDANARTIPSRPWGLGPWEALLGAGHGYRFSTGPVDVWVLDQRRFKSDPTAPDDATKTLLGDRQRAWLLDGLRASTAPLKVICSPCTVFMPFNARDGNWAAGFTAERDALLAHLDGAVSGRVVFVTGDTHLTGVHDRDGRLEVRACPIGIPVPNDITLSDPGAGERLRGTPGVTYADERCHYAVLDVVGTDETATLEIRLRREDGTTPYRKVITEPVPPATLRVGIEALRLPDRARVRVGLDRPGLVRLRATLGRPGGRQTTIADRLVRIDRAGTRRFALRLTGRGRRALRASRGRVRLSVTARHRSATGRTTVARARRVLLRRGR